MADFPDDIYSPRTMVNRPNTTYEASETKRIFAEDFNLDRDEIVAIETFLKGQPKVEVVDEASVAPTDTIGHTVLLIDKEGSSDGVNLVASYEMDEAEWDNTAGEVIDESSHANNGQAVDAVISESGKIDNCGEFNGSDHYVKVPHSDSLALVGDELSIEIWVYCVANAGADYPGIIAKRNAGSGYGSNWGLCINEGSKLVEVHIETSAGNIQFWSSEAIPTGEWVQLIMTYDGANLRFYINNVAKGSTGASGNLINSGGELWIGRHGTNQNSRNWNGKIDLVRIWEKCLTSDERTDLYNSGSARLLDPSGAEVAIELPTAVDNKAIYTVKKINSCNAVITPDGSETIDGEADHTITSLQSAISIVSDGADWQIISKYSS